MKRLALWQILILQVAAYAIGYGISDGQWAAWQQLIASMTVVVFTQCIAAISYLRARRKVSIMAEYNAEAERMVNGGNASQR